MLEEPEFSFLEERPLENSEEFSGSKFGHEEISSALCKIIAKCPTPFTIGLFGRWGAGKSTISNSVKGKLLSENIAVVLFDVWKHEGDALRRTFLKETTQQLKSLGSNYFDKSFVLDERLEERVTRSVKGKLRPNWQLLGQLAYYLLLLFLMAAFFLFISAIFGLTAEYFKLLKTSGHLFLSMIGAGTLAAILLKNGVKFFEIESINYGADKLQDPHEFEVEFGKILEKLKNKRLLVIFDNLDRVTHDKSVEVLSTIKTFLEPKDAENEGKEVVFLVPCDARAIKSHVAKVYKTGEADTVFNPDEFLRKFFNTIIWIPDFIPSELENFAKESLERTKVKALQDSGVAWIITKAFRENPRQIIQFVNILLANYLLIKEREGNQDFPDNFADEKVTQLTKYLILSELYPEEMDELRRIKALILESVKEKELDETRASKREDFFKFLTETERYPVGNLRLFFTLRKSEQEKSFPGIESLISLLDDKQEEEAKDYLDKLVDFSDSQAVYDFSQVIKTELENKTNPVTAISMIETLLTVLSQKKVNLNTTAYAQVNFVLTNLCIDSLYTINPHVIDQQLLSSDAGYRQTIVTKWIEVAESHLYNRAPDVPQDFVKNVLQVLADNPTYLDATLLAQIKELLHKKLFLDDEIASIFTKDEEKQKTFLTAEYVQAIFNSVPNTGDVELLINRLELLKKIDSELMKKAGGNFVLEKLLTLQNSENQDTSPEKLPIKERIAEAFAGFIDAHEETFLSSTPDRGDLFAASLIVAIDSVPEPDNKKIFLPLLKRISAVVSEKKSEIDNRLQNFYAQASQQAIEYTLERINNSQELIEQSQYSTLEGRALSSPQFFEYLYEKMPNEIQEVLLEKLFSQDLERAVQFAEKLKYKLPNPKSFARSALVRFDSVSSPAEKKRMLDVVIALKGTSDASIRDSFSEKLQVLLTNPEAQFQDVGHASLLVSEEFLAATRKRQIAQAVFDWLKKPEIPKNQPSSIRAVYFLREQFNEEERKELIQFIFEEMIRKAGSVSEVELGFSFLSELLPKYEDRKQNFEDIKTRIETEGGGAIKQALIKGLKSLQPKTDNKHNKDYWKWVESLES